MANDNFVIDLTQYKDRFGVRVAPGKYTVVVADAEMDETSKGDPMINMFLEVVDGEEEGATIVDRLLPNHQKAQFRVVNFMRAIGMPTPRKRMQINLRSWIGKIVEVDVRDGEPYNGNVRSEISAYSKSSKAKSESSDLEDMAPLEDGPEDLETDEDIDIETIEL